jgi:transposase
MTRKKRGPSAYTDEFRLEAVRLVLAGVRPLAEIARELGVNQETLRIWVRRQTQQEGGKPHSRRVLLEEENRQLRQQNAKLLEEREILKKAAVFFAKDAR